MLILEFSFLYAITWDWRVWFRLLKRQVNKLPNRAVEGTVKVKIESNL
jgi:hypothetical protein